MILLNYFLYYGIIIPLSKLPMGVLYLLSDCFYIILYRIIVYRKKVVKQNLQNSFPDKSKAELLEIERKFYHHLCDIFVETIKGFSISEKEIRQRVIYTNLDLIHEYYNKNKSVLVVTSHYGNWELAALSMGVYFPHTVMGVYHPLKNKFFDIKFINSRGKFGLHLVSPRGIGSFLKNHKLVLSGFIADQTPHNVYRCHWMTFLNQETPIFYGPENFAKQFDQPVLYANINKPKRGHYSITFEVITDQPIQEKANFITEKHTQLLEHQINKQPEFWLWTHRRWKRKKPADYKPIK